MKIIKKEKEKSEDAEIPKNDSVPGKEMSPEGETQGQRSRHRSTERVPASAAKSLKPKEPKELKQGKSSRNTEPPADKVKNKKKGKGFTDFLNSLIEFGF